MVWTKATRKYKMSLFLGGIRRTAKRFGIASTLEPRVVVDGIAKHIPDPFSCFSHLGLEARAPPRAPAGGQALQAA